MDWLITYSLAGERRYTRIATRALPNLKAVAFTVYTLEFPDQPKPSRSSAAVEDWLKGCGIEILDVSPLQRKGSSQT
ncbi:RidA family protein [Pseudomonas sp. zfem005]|uniref:RidA family protein n=1 Tax=Pseudomonas sp. zfem005 TaxID=3078200 RepID=UPI002929C8D7|nr:RidA family protein [Pseudomonas sp. zfem005]MDU9415232.1 RidA family protein [Pseudomonas sp. zfem005]